MIDSVDTYVQRHWVTKRSIGPARLSVGDNRCRTNNILESFYASLRRRIKVSHPNLYAFLGHLQNTTDDNMNDVAHTDALLPSQHADSSDDDDAEQLLTPTAASASAAASVPGAPAAADTVHHYSVAKYVCWHRWKALPWCPVDTQDSARTVRVA